MDYDELTNIALLKLLEPDLEEISKEPITELLTSIFSTIGEKNVNYGLAKGIYSDVEILNEGNIEKVIENLTDEEINSLSERLVTGLVHLSDHQLQTVQQHKRIFAIITLKLISKIAHQFQDKKAINKYTFALPSHPIMRIIMSLFAGKSSAIPRRLLDKSIAKSPEEQQAVKEFIQSMFVDEQYYKDNRLEKVTYALICDTNKVEAKAIIDQSLFQDDLQIQEEELAVYIKRTFGVEGLRHFYGFLITMEENNRNGYFEWEVNEHLERLGYQRKTNGSFNPDLKKFASKVILLLTNLVLIGQYKNGKNRQKIEGIKLFHMEKFSRETFKDTIISERLGIRASEIWYTPGFFSEDGKTRMFTKLLRKIAKENHQEHPITIYLSPHFAIDWRMNKEKKITVKNLMEMCNLDINSHHRFHYLRNLEDELIYMKREGYLGDWENISYSGKKPSECPNPFECLLKVKSPEWLDNEFKFIEAKRESVETSVKQVQAASPLTREDFINIFEKSNLSVIDFANKLSISRRMFYFIKNGEREMTSEIQNKLRAMQKV